MKVMKNKAIKDVKNLYFLHPSEIATNREIESENYNSKLKFVINKGKEIKNSDSTAQLEVWKSKKTVGEKDETQPKVLVKC